MSHLPKARVNRIIIQELDKELLIYDLKIDKAFCLNETSALVWLECDGTKSVAQISQQLNRKLKENVTEDFVWLALDRFKQENLLDNEAEVEIDFGGLSRREIIRKVGFASMIALPVISSITAPQSVMAQSCSGAVCPGATNGCCNSGSNCCNNTHCCSSVTPCCGSTCCGTFSSCCNNTHCCSIGSVCCGTGCCDSGQQCCGGTCFNSSSGSCCGTVVCTTGQFCCNNNHCCSTGQTCCNNTCCNIGETCVLGTCRV